MKENHVKSKVLEQNSEMYFKIFELTVFFTTYEICIYVYKISYVFLTTYETHSLMEAWMIVLNKIKISSAMKNL